MNKKLNHYCKRNIRRLFIAHGIAYIILCSIISYIINNYDKQKLKLQQENNIVAESVLPASSEVKTENNYAGYECCVNIYRMYQEDKKVGNKVANKTSTLKKNKYYYYNVPLNKKLQRHIYKLCKKYEVEDKVSLIMAVVEQESDFNAKAKSTTNDYGLMQINKTNFPELEEKLGITNMLNPYQNIHAGIYILSGHLKNTENIHKSLMCYNMGAKRTNELWEKGIRSSQYSRSIIKKYKKYEKQKDMNKPQSED